MFEHSLKNAYIGEYWSPNANTVAYYPFTSTTTVNDQSGNNRNLTNSGVSFGVNQGVDCGTFDGNSIMQVSNFYNISQGAYTVNVWAYKGTQKQNLDYYIFAIGDLSSRGGSSIIEYDGFRLRYALWYDDLDANTNPSGVWTNICCVYSSGTQYLYVNGTLNNSRSTTYTHSLGALTLYVGGHGNNKRTGLMSNLIVENNGWTADEISSYYNKTKSTYGL